VPCAWRAVAVACRGQSESRDVVLLIDQAGRQAARQAGRQPGRIHSFLPKLLAPWLPLDDQLTHNTGTPCACRGMAPSEPRDVVLLINMAGRQAGRQADRQAGRQDRYVPSFQTSLFHSSR
jgi:hypothetical protein